MTRTLCVIAGAALLLSASAAFAESVWVQSESVEVRSGKGAVYPTLATAKKGQELTVVSRDGKWVQVQIAGAASPGWVYDTALSAQKVSGSNGFSFSPDTAQLGTAAAGRGLNPSAEQYVSGRHLDKRPLEWLISLNKSVPPAQWERFCTDGRVGPAGGQAR